MRFGGSSAASGAGMVGHNPEESEQLECREHHNPQLISISDNVASYSDVAHATSTCYLGALIMTMSTAVLV